MTRKLDLLVVAPSAKDLYQELATDFSAKEPNIWAGLLANSARNSGYGVALYDMEIERPSEKEFADIVEQHDPRLILFVVTGQNLTPPQRPCQGLCRPQRASEADFPATK